MNFWQPLDNCFSTDIEFLNIFQDLMLNGLFTSFQFLCIIFQFHRCGRQCCLPTVHQVDSGMVTLTILYS